MLPNAGMSFSPFAILTAEEMNDLVENIEALADGSGLDNGAVTGAKIDFAATGAGGVWWEEIGRTTLGVAGDVITVSSLPARRYLRIMFTLIATGGTIDTAATLNGDSGSNYSRAVPDLAGGGAVGNVTGASNIPMETGSVASGAIFHGFMDAVNIANQPKLLTHQISHGVVSAGTAPSINIVFSKWSNNTDAISSITISNSGTGDYAVGSEVIVLGHN